MIRFPNCKINIGLHITSKRSDGYHNIESVFLPVPWCDVLEIIPAQDGVTRLFISGISLDGPAGDNLCMKAFSLLEQDFQIAPVHIYLHKNIPTGAGLGGGSSNGAFTLLMLNELFSLGLGPAPLKKYALRLGSDCPFFIDNRAALASGRGDVLSPVSMPLAGCHILIVKPELHSSTASAYAGIVPDGSGPPLAGQIKQPLSQWRHHITNAFEKVVFANYPEVAAIKEELYRIGAAYASMSGSGSAVYGIFSEKPDAADLFPGSILWQGKL